MTTLRFILSVEPQKGFQWWASSASTLLGSFFPRPSNLPSLRPPRWECHSCSDARSSCHALSACSRAALSLPQGQGGNPGWEQKFPSTTLIQRHTVPTAVVSLNPRPLRPLGCPRRLYEPVEHCVYRPSLTSHVSFHTAPTHTRGASGRGATH